jgi:hypothetical protein
MHIWPEAFGTLFEILFGQISGGLRIIMEISKCLVFELDNIDENNKEKQ